MILYLYCVSDSFGDDFMQNGFKFLMHLESKTSQFEIGVQSIAHLNTQFTATENFELLLAINHKQFWQQNSFKF